MSKIKPKKLEFNDPDEDIIYMLDYYYRLKRTCEGKITYTELKCFQELMLIDLCAWQCEAIMQID